MKRTPLHILALAASLVLATGCAAPLIMTGVMAGGSIVGAEVESHKEKGKRNDNWDYADEYFARNRTQVQRGNLTESSLAMDQQTNKTRPGAPRAAAPLRSVSIPMP